MMAEARRRCEFDFATMRAALDRGDLQGTLVSCTDVERELKRLRREVERTARAAEREAHE